MSAGDFLSLLCAVTFALHFVVTAHFSPIAGFETLAVVQIAVAAVLGFRFRLCVRSGAFSCDSGARRGHAGYGIARYSISVYHHGVGSAAHVGHADRGDSDAGTGGGLVHVVRGNRRNFGPSR